MNNLFKNLIQIKLKILIIYIIINSKDKINKQINIIFYNIYKLEK